MKMSHLKYALFLTPVGTPNYLLWQMGLVLLVAICFIAMPQLPPIDWVLNTQGFWADIPHTYLSNANFVYPPWGLILLLPYYAIGAAGSRVLSVLVVGWLAYSRRWSFYFFFLVILSPYFIVTMSKSNMDILVTLLPLLLWETAKGKRWEVPVRGFAIAMMLLKPQITALVILYLLWKSRLEWKKVLKSLGVTALFVVPISLVGSPMLIWQWLDNLRHPSEQNQFFWSINNVSLTTRFGVWIGLGLLALAIILVWWLWRKRLIAWSGDLTIASLLLASMFLLPYSSQQSFSSGLAFLPTGLGFGLQWLVVSFGLLSNTYLGHISEWTFGIALLCLLFAAFQLRKHPIPPQAE